MTLRRRYAAMSTAEVQNLLAAGASPRVALLPAKTSKQALAETLAAMANAGGGVALLGVTAKGAPQSGTDLGALRDLVVEASVLPDPPLILPSPQRIDLGDAEIMVVAVPEGLPHVYNVRGVYLTRTGGLNRPLTTPELRQLLLNRAESGYESQPVEEASLADLDSARISRYVDQLGLPPDEEMVEALLSRGCVTRHNADGLPTETPLPTVAGLLLFGINPQRFLRSAEIICVRYAGAAMSDEFVRQACWWNRRGRPKPLFRAICAAGCASAA